jgi:PAS domain S-box-containing protein
MRLRETQPTPENIADNGVMASVHGPDWTYLNASSTAYELLGYRPEDLIGKWAFEYVHPDDITRVVLALRYAHEAAPFVISYRTQHGNGLYVWVERLIDVRQNGSRAEEVFICHTRRVAEPEALASLQRQHADRFAQVQRVLLSEDLRIAFQPLVELDTERVMGYEALSRFPGDPARTPDRWFADAWALGLGVPLELLAVKKAVRALDRMPGDVEISVNASPPTLAARGFMKCVGPHAGRITVELTEHLEIADYDEFRQAVAPLRSAGGRLAIDDFGAGFASLKHILSVQPDRIKLDISLTERVGESPLAHALTTALLSFAGEIGIEVIAEGIETEEELDSLTEIGVRLGQGFHFGVPAPLEQALAASMN